MKKIMKKMLTLLLLSGTLLMSLCTTKKEISPEIHIAPLSAIEKRILAMEHKIPQNGHRQAWQYGVIRQISEIKQITNISRIYTYDNGQYAQIEIKEPYESYTYGIEEQLEVRTAVMLYRNENKIEKVDITAQIRAYQFFRHTPICTVSSADDDEVEEVDIKARKIINAQLICLLINSEQTLYNAESKMLCIDTGVTSPVAPKIDDIIVESMPYRKIKK